MAATDSDKTYFDEFRRYYSGEMSHKQQHRFETRMLEDSLFADAYEGYLILMEEKVDHGRILKALDRQLVGRAREKKKQILPFWGYAAAASAILLFAWFVSTNYERVGTNDVTLDQASMKLQTNTADSTTATSPIIANIDSVTTDNSQNLLSQSNKKEPQVQKILGNKSDRVAANNNGADIIVTSPVPLDDSQSQPQPANGLEHSQPLPAQPLATPGFSVHSQSPARKAPSSINKTVGYINVVQGRIVDANGQGLPGVNVLRSENGGVETDSNGNFRMEIAKPDSLRIASIGYKTKLVTVDKLNLGDIKLEEDLQALSEVVVVGYGAKSKRSSGLFKKTDIQARPSVGWESYQLYLTQTGETGVYGVVKVKFKVNEDGALSDFSAKGGTALQEKAFKLIKNGSTWIPAEKNNVKVAAFVTVTAVFKK